MTQSTTAVVRIEHPIIRAIRERIESTQATQRGRPWTVREYIVGHALPMSSRDGA